MEQTSSRVGEEQEDEMFYDAQMGEFNEEEENVYSNPLSSEQRNKMLETRNREIRERELINVRSIRDRAFKDAHDGVIGARPVIYGLSLCTSASYIKFKVKIIDKDIQGLFEDWERVEDRMYELVRDYKEKQEMQEKSGGC